MIVRDLRNALNQLYPEAWAEGWDNVGLIVGHSDAPVSRVLVSLDLTEGVIAEAIELGAQAIVTHHPPIFKGVKQFDFERTADQRLQILIKNDLSVLTAHTNFDVAPGGTNEILAQVVGLVDPQVLLPNGHEPLYKLVVFVPESHAVQVRQALGDAGAGHIGGYSHCAFMAPGTGSFVGGDGAQPFIGQVGHLTEVREVRLETVLPKAKLPSVMKALLAAHPYEEVAYDLYELKQPGPVRGHGRIGQLQRSETVASLAARLREELPAGVVRVVGVGSRPLKRVAVGPGSGAMLIAAAAAQGADALVAGDLDYHDAQAAQDLGLALIDPGHFGTEMIAMASLAKALGEATGLAVSVARSQRDLFAKG